MNILSRLGGAA